MQNSDHTIKLLLVSKSGERSIVSVDADEWSDFTMNVMNQPEYTQFWLQCWDEGGIQWFINLFEMGAFSICG